MKISFCFLAIEFQRHFLRRPSKVRKLVRTNQFQVESTKIGTVRKFVTLQYMLACLRLCVMSQLSRATLRSISTHKMMLLSLAAFEVINFVHLHDLICTTPRLCQNNMTPVALRGRGTTSTYNCFPATGLYFKSKVLASVGRGSTETTRLQHGSSMFGDTHAKWGGGGGGI